MKRSEELYQFEIAKILYAEYPIGDAPVEKDYVSPETAPDPVAQPGIPAGELLQGLALIADSIKSMPAPQIVVNVAPAETKTIVNNLPSDAPREIKILRGRDGQGMITGAISEPK